MAGPRVVQSSDAARDLTSIYDWIAEDSGARRARAVLERFERAFNQLAAFPGMGRLQPQYAGAPRSFPVSPWMVFYEPLEDGRGITVLRVVDGRRDLSAVLGREEG